MRSKKKGDDELQQEFARDKTSHSGDRSSFRERVRKGQGLVVRVTVTRHKVKEKTIPSQASRLFWRSRVITKRDARERKGRLYGSR